MMRHVLGLPMVTTSVTGIPVYLIQVVYMMNGVVSDPSSITVTVQSPTSVGLVVTSSQGQASCESGWADWDRRVIWQVLDQFGSR